MRLGLTALAVVGVLALAGCSSQEEPLVLGADGSGDFDRTAAVTATLPSVDDGPAVGRATAEADRGGVRIEVRVRDLEPGTWTASLAPGTRCADATGAGTRELPELVVDEDGRGLLDTVLDDVPLADLASGAALTLEGPGGTTCGTLADH